MAFTPHPHEQYTIRRKIFTLFGASFHVYDQSGHVVAFCRQKAFKLREDIRLYTSQAMTEELLTMKARNIIDFGATYDIFLPTGELIGSLRRKGLKSMFRDFWLIYDHEGIEQAAIVEDSSTLAFLRRIHGLFAMLSPEQYKVVSNEDRHIATIRTHMNPFVYRLGVAIHEDDPDLDELIILAAACLIAAIEGRQGSYD